MGKKDKITMLGNIGLKEDEIIVDGKLMKKSEYKLYTARRWTDIPKFITTGYTEFTEEEKKQNEKNFHEFLVKNGYIKDDK